jgi:outer membrane protein assembly factor BamB
LFGFTLLWLVGLAMVPPSGHAQVYYQQGFTYKLSGSDAQLGIRDATLTDALVVLQVGTKHLVGISLDSSMERWRFTSKTSSIRKIHHRAQDLLVEAEQLYSLDPHTGAMNWQVQLNCYSDSACNTRVHRLDAKSIYLTGFDGRDDNLMVVDATSGLQQWPVWIGVPHAIKLAVSGNMIVIASGKTPYPLLGLDKRTGRVRWRFRPAGSEKPVAGMSVCEKGLTAWWPGLAANTVYSLNPVTGEEIASWIVARRARSEGTLRGGGAGYHYLWQPSLIGDDGTLRVWNTKTGQPLWRKRLRLVRPPVVSKGRIYLWMRPYTVSKRLSLVVQNVRTGKELWRFDRNATDVPDMKIDGELLVVRMSKTDPIVITFLAATGQILGVGALPSQVLKKGDIRPSGRYLLAMHGGTIERLDPVSGDDLLQRFDDHVSNGEVDEAARLHKKLRPFVDELKAAAMIHRRLVGRKYQNISKKIRSRSFAAMLISIQRMATDERIVFYEDFRSFVIQLKSLMEERSLPKVLRGSDGKRLYSLIHRLQDLLGRFERKLNTNDDDEANAAVTGVMARLCIILCQSGRSSEAFSILSGLWTSTWLDRTPALTDGMKTILKNEIRRLLPSFASAVKRGKGQREAVEPILTLQSLKLLVAKAPSRMDLSGMDNDDYASLLGRLRAASR